MHPSADHLRLRPDAGDEHPQRRAGARVPAVRQGPRRLRARRGRRRAGPRAALVAAARGREPYAVLAGAGVTSDCLRHRRARPERQRPAPRRSHGARARRPRPSATSCTSTRTRRRRRPATAPRPSGSPTCSASSTVVTATKSMTGHLLGAAGAIESIATVLAVQNDIVRRRSTSTTPTTTSSVDVPRQSTRDERPGRAERLVRLRRAQRRPAVPQSLIEPRNAMTADARILRSRSSRSATRAIPSCAWRSCSTRAVVVPLHARRQRRLRGPRHDRRRARHRVLHRRH